MLHQVDLVIKIVQNSKNLIAKFSNIRNQNVHNFKPLSTFTKSYIKVTAVLS